MTVVDLPEPNPDEAIRVVVETLQREFEHHDPAVVEAIVRRGFEELEAQSKAPSFIGVLAERLARDWLAANPPGTAEEG